MASDDVLSGGADFIFGLCALDFALAGLFAVGYLLALSPFFEGFVILGFEAFLGCATVFAARWLWARHGSRSGPEKAADAGVPI